VFVATGTILAEGWNKTSQNPMWHGEIDAINRLAESSVCIAKTAELCPMCHGAVLWSGIETVVYATSIRSLQRLGWRQIDILAEEVVRRRPAWHCALIGGDLGRECHALIELTMSQRDQPK
jgi:tRNA(adenine34) deaminase